ncbi:hypothetical protein [Salinimonas chungwhensis]|uniref:hypothetical protein n=1 Tax=Salinimonas chungwhensis TaxID=265425 RepID=UPI00037A262D|nr:hypothetical protein [Salinimonas chungwhensis]
MKSITVAVLGWCVMTAPGFATGSFEQSAQNLCGKIQQCAYKEMGTQENITPQIRSMIEGVVDSMCDQYLAQTNAVQPGEAQQAAVACLDSLAALSCEVLQSGQPATDACNKFETMAEKYSQ